MQVKRALPGLLGIIILVVILITSIGIISQPIYSLGFSFTLVPEGFRVVRVDENSSWYVQGLRPGQVLSRIQTYNAIPLFTISRSSLSDFLSISTRMFEPTMFGTQLEIQRTDGRLFSAQFEQLAFSQRFSAVQIQVKANILAAFLFLVFGIWIWSGLKYDASAWWFTGFSLTVAPTILISYFFSYWNWEFLLLRFLLFDFGAISAAVFLGGFARRFPHRPNSRLKLWELSPLLFPIGKYLLIGFGVISLYGGAHLQTQVILIISFIYVLYIFYRRYRQISAGRKRQLRWIFLAIAVSLVPFFLYTINLMITGNLVSYGFDLFTLIATISFSLFPIFVGLGIWKYRILDIDQIINYGFALFLLGFLLTGFASLVAFFLLGDNFTPQVYGSLLITGLLSPFAFQLIKLITKHFFSREQKTYNQILLEMEEQLKDLVDESQVYPIVTSSLVYAFDPLYVTFIKSSGGTKEELFCYPPEFNHLTFDRDDAFLQTNPRLLQQDNSVILNVSFDKSNPIFLVIGPRRNDDIFTKDSLALIERSGSQIAKTLKVCSLYQKLQQSIRSESMAQQTTILTLAKLTEYRDRETGRHLERIQSYTRTLAQAYKDIKGGIDYVTNQYIEDLTISSVLHDIGKVGVPDSILLKPGKLTKEEFEVIKTHTIIGSQVLEETEASNPTTSFLTMGRLVCLHHHERWDGTGYPYQLKGIEIPLSARIVAIADVYDALRSTRPYKNPMTHKEALSIIKAEKATHFDPELVDVFLAIEEEIDAIQR
jgi:HD-GYP domain-containing protein (c-di-GMP phosphodiesterase class II)